jgi:GPH family glycoside/pentoside/hexuronide:cation symporter
MVSALLAVPFWVWLARFFEKRHLWLYAMVQGGIGYSLIFWIGEGSWLLMAISSLLAGTAGACGSTLGQALKAEIIDFDEYRTGERKEGAYFATWSFVSKLAAGIMIGVVGISLDLAGYVQNAAEQSETVKRTMTFLMGGVPMVGYALGSLAFTRFGLSEAEHTRIRSELDARNVDGGGGT